VVELVRAMAMVGQALCLPGNHDAKFVRAARGHKVKKTQGLTQTLEQYALWESGRAGSLAAGADFLDRLVGWSVITCWMTGAWWWRTPA
jgi:protein phosphatase